MTNTSLKTLIAGIALLTGASVANASDFNAASAQPALANGDFGSMVIRVNEYEYRRCGRLAIAVYNNCLRSAGSNSQRIRQCRSTYQRQVQICHGLR
ncbi:MAG: hypothetical protein AAF441_10935 [Pseudomonadota bacterium]